MGYPIKQSQTAQALVFLLVQSSDHITGLTGAAPTVTLSKNGAAFAASAGAVTEIANGWYKVAGNATDSNTLGPLILHATAAGADPTDDVFPIVAYDPQDAVHLGLSALPNAAAAAAGGLPTVGSGAGQIAPDGTGAVPVAYGPLLPGVPPTNTVGYALKQAAALLFDGSSYVKSDPQTSVSVAGNVTVGGYAAGEDPATLVLGATATSWNTAGTIGQKINAAGGASDPLTNAVPGSYAAGTAGYVLGTYLDAAVSSRLAASSYTAAPTTAQIATAVWTDLLSSVDFSTAASIGNLLKTDIDAPVSSRLAASSYAAPPTSAAIATAVWTDLLASADFATAGSVGNLLKTDIDTNIGSRLAAAAYTAAPSVAAIATAVWTDATAGDFAAAGTPGDVLVKQLGGTFTTATSSVFTAAALANAPTGGGGGSVTVAGYAVGQDPATLVLGASATTWDGAGTIGQKINSAGGAADPLTNLVPGSYASGTAGNVLGHLSQAQITVSSIVAAGGDISVRKGDSYYAADGRALQWTDASAQWPNLTGATLLLSLDYGGNQDWTQPVTCINPGAAQQTLQLELAATVTQTMPSGSFAVAATLSNGHTVTLVDAYATATVT